MPSRVVRDADHARKLLGPKGPKEFEKAWQANWEATAVALDAVIAAKAGLLDAERAAIGCPDCHAAEGRGVCASHYAALTGGVEQVTDAAAAHEAAVATFKKGVRL